MIDNRESGRRGNLLPDLHQLRMHELRNVTAADADQMIVVRLVEADLVVVAVAPEVVAKDDLRLFEEFERRVDGSATRSRLVQDHCRVQFVGVEMSLHIEDRLEHLESLRRRAEAFPREKC